MTVKFDDARSTRPLVALVGPTATGKSDLALHLAESFGAEIINYDSIQLYRRLDIGSAKPSAESQRRVRHHLIDCLDPDQVMNAGLFARGATEILQQLARTGTLPILAGGTGFYLRALLEGLSPAPEADPQVRTRLSRSLARRPRVLHRFLRRFDPAAASSIHENDVQKSIRAVEIAILAKLPTTKAQAAAKQSLQGYRVLKIGIVPPRAELHSRVNARAQHMFDSGLIEETRGILQDGYSPDLPALASLGYRQAVRYILGQSTLEESLKDCQTRTRQYAKRQVTWFRREANVHWLTGVGSDPNTKKLATHLVADFLSAD